MALHNDRKWMYSRVKNGQLSYGFMRGLEDCLEFARSNSSNKEIRY